MGFAIVNQVVGDRTLSQQGIGGNVLALDIDGIEQGNGGFYLVGAFAFLVARCGEGTNFFWVWHTLL